MANKFKKFNFDEISAGGSASFKNKGTLNLDSLEILLSDVVSEKKDFVIHMEYKDDRYGFSIYVEK